MKKKYKFIGNEESLLELGFVKRDKEFLRFKDGNWLIVVDNNVYTLSRLQRSDRIETEVIEELLNLKLVEVARGY